MKLEEPTREAVVDVLLIEAIAQTAPLDQVADQLDRWKIDHEIISRLGYAISLDKFKLEAGKTYEEVVRNLMTLAGVTEQGDKMRSLLDVAIARDKK